MPVEAESAPPEHPCRDPVRSPLLDVGSTHRSASESRDENFVGERYSPRAWPPMGCALGLAVMGATFAVLIAADPEKFGALSSLLAPAVAARAPEPTPVPRPSLPRAPRHLRRGCERSAPLRLRLPPPPRCSWPDCGALAELASTPDIKIVEGTMERRSFVEALGASRRSRGADLSRCCRLSERASTSTSANARTAFAVALELPSRHVRAFEYQAGPTEIYQARERDDGSLVGRTLDLHVEKKRAIGGGRGGRRSGGIAPERRVRPDFGRLPRRRARRPRAALQPSRGLAAADRRRTTRPRSACSRVTSTFRRSSTCPPTPTLQRSRLPISQQEERTGYFDAKGPPALQRRLSQRPSRSRGSRRASTCTACIPSCTWSCPTTASTSPHRSGTPVYAACVRRASNGSATAERAAISSPSATRRPHHRLCPPSRFAPHLARVRASRRGSSSAMSARPGDRPGRTCISAPRRTASSSIPSRSSSTATACCPNPSAPSSRATRRARQGARRHPAA